MNNDVAGEIAFAVLIHLVIAIVFLLGACIALSTRSEPEPVPASCSCECQAEEL